MNFDKELKNLTNAHADVKSEIENILHDALSLIMQKLEGIGFLDKMTYLELSLSGISVHCLDKFCPKRIASTYVHFVHENKNF